MDKTDKWSFADLSNAMECSVRNHANPRLVKVSNDKLVFNGFWRNGDKPNVCIWLKKATWADAKTGDGGGCKEFAKVAFNLSLPEFLERFGLSFALPRSKEKTITKKPIPHSKSIDEIWSELVKKQNGRSNEAERWLIDVRGFASPKKHIGSGFSSLENDDISLFDKRYQNFVRQRLLLGPQLIAPLRNTHSSKVQNLFFRCLSDVSKTDKSRLLPDYGGWTEQDGSPRAFGFPHMIHEFPKLILCEGMADYFSTECLLADTQNAIAIGAANACALINWATWLIANKYKGTVIILYQLDKDNSGRVSPDGIGQTKAIEAMKIFRNHGFKVQLFDWHLFLQNFKHSFDLARVSDLADVCRLGKEKAIPFEDLSHSFLTTIN